MEKGKGRLVERKKIVEMEQGKHPDKKRLK
jgi:hypothetical protein